MGRILFGSEFGANLGHIYPMLRLADRLRQRGNHDIIFAVRNPLQATEKIKSHGYKVLQAPFWTVPPIKDINKLPTARYTDVLARQGFGLTGRLENLASAWIDLVETIDADLVIADHSPCLSFAMRGTRPMINMGNGFTLPPSSVEEYPRLQKRADLIVEEKQLLGVFQKAAEKLGIRPLERLPQIFDTEGAFVVTVPEMDAYADLRTEEYVGPIEDHLEPCEGLGPERVFLYMAYTAKGAQKTIEAVKQSGVPATLFVRSAPLEFLNKYQSDKMEMLREPADFSKVIPASSLVIHSGGGGTSTTCMLAGRPQIICPSHLETRLNCAAITRQNVGYRISSESSVDEIATLIKEAVEDIQLQERALHLAKKLDGEDWKNGLDIICDKAEELIA
ncbi:hypothetical protein GUA87_16400 [Sneathiella sp. P13V-1]|uniref:glycosyltransferase n=1 Tax=Sneathiella sp. P13V-1 TaxID=2697366 RepID=UPI00187BB299|nr:nucleotide disphospho-sugar-binding domain-containing protein [Sneathiella sp. P13V-1]MBE7638439.1 hypothetical protein [Sneathiella sp. P13V-1]